MLSLYLQKFERYLQLDRGLSKSSMEAYIRDCHQFCELIKARTISDNDLNDYSKYLLEHKYSYRSIRRKLTSIKQFYYYLNLHHSDIYHTSVMTISPKVPTILPKVLSVEEVELLLNYSDPNSSFPIRDRAILEVMYSCGLRVSELIRLSLEDLKKSTIHITGKGNKDRVLPIGKIAKHYLNDYIKTERHKLIHKKPEESGVFLNKNASPLTRQFIYTLIKKNAEGAGITKQVSPHSLRHSYATHLLDGGSDLIEVKSLLGHESIVTTQIYTHLAKKELKSVYKQYHPRS